MTLAGLPPFSGFLGKLMLLNTLRGVEAGVAMWTILLLAAFLGMMALARAGSVLIWENGPGETPSPACPTARIGWRRLAATLCLIAAGPLLAVFAQPVSGYAQRTAAPVSYTHLDVYKRQSLHHVWHIRQLQTLAYTGHQYQRQGKANATAKGKAYRLS